MRNKAANQLIVDKINIDNIDEAISEYKEFADLSQNGSIEVYNNYYHYLNLLENIKATVITYGFNSKATITASSVEEEEMMLCIQRSMEDKEGKVIEPQEVKIPLCENVNCTMAIASCLLLYGKII